MAWIGLFRFALVVRFLGSLHEPRQIGPTWTVAAMHGQRKPQGKVDQANCQNEGN
jgi:hypothetical protein